MLSVVCCLLLFVCCTWLSDVRCVLFVVYLFVVGCLLFGVCSALIVGDCLWFAVWYLLCVVYCLMCVVRRCVLFAVC